MSTSQQFATFRLADLWFGIDVLQVQEVLRYQEMTRVPLASDAISGLVNLRGQLVTAIDLRRVFEMEPRAAAQLPMSVVTCAHQGLLSLLVDEISDVVSLDDAEFVPPPDTVPAVARKMVVKVCALKDKLLMILNNDAISKLILP